MQVGSIIRHRINKGLYLVIGETYGTWEALTIGTQATVTIAKTTKAFEVIA
jgi:hypothetical protein